jgi:hypothetical protein
LAGRREELAVVRHHVEEGAGRLLLVAGEAGIGKTRLIEAAQAGCAAFLARGAGLPMSVEVPFLPVANALADAFRADESWFRESVASCPSYVGEALAPLLPDLGTDRPAAHVPEASARSLLFKAVAAVLEALAVRRAVALVIDDLHWADPGTFDLVEQLVATGAGVPVLCAVRTEDPSVCDRVEPWSARMCRLANVETLELGPLTRAGTAEQLRLLAAPDRSPVAATDPIVDLIHSRSLGLPLFTEQLALRPDGPLPRLLDDVLGQRVADLTPEEHRVAALLGVADRDLTVEALREATGLPPAALTGCLHSLTDRRLLGAGERSVALRHPLLAEAVRHRLVPGEAADLHRRLATVLAAGGDAAEVAAHWQGAGDDEQELVWRIRAARSARDRLASEEEARQWRRSLELWPGDDLDERHGLRRIDALLAELDAVERSGRTDEARALIAPVLGRADDLPATTAADVWCRAASLADLVEGTLAALGYAERAAAAYDSAPAGPGLVRALTEHAIGLVWAGRLEEARAVDARLVAVCRSLDDPAQLRHALVQQAGHLGLDGWSRQVRTILDEARSVRTPRPDPDGDVLLAFVETDLVLKFGGGTDALVAAARDGMAAAEAWQLETSELALGLRGNLAEGLLHAGHVAEAAALVDPITDEVPLVDGWMVHAVQVAVDTVRGRLDAATQRSWALQDAVPAVQEDREIAALVTACELWSGRADLSLERLSGVVQKEVGSVDRIMAAECQVLAARAAADLADAGVAPRSELCRRVAALLAGDDPIRMPSEARDAYRATRAAELSRLAAQPRVDLWSAAAAGWDLVGRPFESAYARWRGAQAAHVTGAGTVADRLLRRAARDAHGHLPLEHAIRATQRTRAALARTTG